MARKRTAASPTIDRTIHFYRVDPGVDVGGRQLPFDPIPALAAIERLPFVDGPTGRYLLVDNGNAICVWMEARTPLSLRFCLIRRNGLPQLEQAGTVSDLNVAADAGLLEPVHVVFFSDNIVGAEFNFHGPRVSRLGRYLSLKSGQMVPPASFQPLLRLDVADQLNHLRELRLLDFKIKRSYIDAVRMADASLADAFDACGRILDGNADDIQLVLRSSNNFRHYALQRLAAPLKALLRNPDLRDNVARLQVSGLHDESGRVEIIDLLHDQLITRKQILRLGSRSRAVQADSAYAAIESAHDELADQLQSAASLVW